MVARRGRGRANLRDDRDEEIQVLWRQVEELTMRFERREARSGWSSSSHGYGSDESEDVNPFVNQQVRGETIMERFLRASEVVKIDLPEFHGRL